MLLIPPAALVIEVADSTLAFDTTQKAGLYAAARIADYWVVDLIAKRLLVFRDPRPDRSQSFGATYATITANLPPATVSPLCAPQAIIPVAELLP